MPYYCTNKKAKNEALIFFQEHCYILSFEEETVYGEGIFLQISFMSRENVTIGSVFSCFSIRLLISTAVKPIVLSFWPTRF